MTRASDPPAAAESIARILKSVGAADGQVRVCLRCSQRCYATHGICDGWHVCAENKLMQCLGCVYAEYRY